MKTVKKGWGEERILVNEPEYCSKIMTVLPDKQCSMHFHKNKKETFCIMHGKLSLELIDMTTGRRYIKLLCEGMRYTLLPLTPHRFRSAMSTPCSFIEISTHDDVQDSYRVEPGDSQK